MKSERGNVALSTVIIVCSVLLLGGVALVLASANLAHSTKNYESRMILEGISRTCLEESLIKLKSEPTYEGQVQYSNSHGSCTATIATDLVDPDLKNIVSESELDEYLLTSTTVVDVSTSPFQIIR